MKPEHLKFAAPVLLLSLLSFSKMNFILNDNSIQSKQPSAEKASPENEISKKVFREELSMPYQAQLSCTPVSVPYQENFDGVTAPALPACITTQDLNANTTWNNGTTSPRSAPNCMIYSYNSAVGGDDWFYTAPLTLTSGTSYRLRFWYKARNAGFPERLEVKYGSNNTAASMTIALFTNTNIINTTYQQATIDFTPASTGTYFIGFHCNSLADQFDLNVDDISVIVTPSCGEPTALSVLVNTNNTSGTASWSAPGVGTPVGYEYVIDNTSADPAGAGTAVASTSTPLTGLTPFTIYYLHVRTDCGSGNFSAWATRSFITIANDELCGAIPLTLGGVQECANDSAATSVNDPSFSCSTPNNTLWYSYTPASNGRVNVATEIPAAGNPLNGWIGWYTASGSCPALSLTQIPGSTCTQFGDSGNGDKDTISSPVLTAGVTYYIMIDGFGGDFGSFCLKLIAPPPPPTCTGNLSPANGATGVSITSGTPISWNAAAGATSYDIFFGNSNPPLANIGNIAGTTATITRLSYNTTYYWYVVPKNVSGAATGCDVNSTSFTTENPINCTPLYGAGACSFGDSITYFSLKGEPGTAVYNNTGGVCNTSPNGYIDYTALSTPLLIPGNAYSGLIRTGDPNDYVSMWIDFNDNGYFEDNECLMNNLKIGTARVLYSLFIPIGSTPGFHRLRVRNVYYGSQPTEPTHPCNPYTYGETEDYKVQVLNTSPAIRNVSAGIPNGCLTASAVVIDSVSNMSQQSFIPIVDSFNNLIAYIYPNGNNLGRVTTNLYVNNGPVRQDPKGIYFLDRNITITPQRQPVRPYNLRYFFKQTELNALIAQPGSGVNLLFDLGLSKTNQDTCSRGIGPGVVGSFYFPTGFGSYNGDRLIDISNLPSFSTFYLHGGSVSLPVTLVSFAGSKEGNRNVLRWTTASEVNADGFVIEASSDGAAWKPLGFVPSKAVGGNSSSELNYTYNDDAPQGAVQYYRLKQVDKDGKFKMSNVIKLRSSSKLFTLSSLYPNPAGDVLNMMIEVPLRDRLTVLITDASGRQMLQQVTRVETGTNNVQLDVHQLSAGMYIVKIISSNGETTSSKFVKQ